MHIAVGAESFVQGTTEARSQTLTAVVSILSLTCGSKATDRPHPRPLGHVGVPGKNSWGDRAEILRRQLGRAAGVVVRVGNARRVVPYGPSAMDAFETEWMTDVATTTPLGVDLGHGKNTGACLFSSVESVDNDN